MVQKGNILELSADADSQVLQQLTCSYGAMGVVVDVRLAVRKQVCYTGTVVVCMQIWVMHRSYGSSSKQQYISGVLRVTRMHRPRGIIECFRISQVAQSSCGITTYCESNAGSISLRRQLNVD